jgi:hypothetical protein
MCEVCHHMCLLALEVGFIRCPGLNSLGSSNAIPFFTSPLLHLVISAFIHYCPCSISSNYLFTPLWDTLIVSKSPSICHSFQRTRKNSKYSEKTCPSANLSIIHPIWFDPGSKPGRRRFKPETTWFSLVFLKSCFRHYISQAYSLSTEHFTTTNTISLKSLLNNFVTFTIASNSRFKISLYH